jgi:uroporphyrinogen-III decarboxylase
MAARTSGMGKYMEAKKEPAFRPTVFTEEERRRIREFGDEMDIREVVELVSRLREEVRRKVVLALFAKELGLAQLPATPDTSEPPPLRRPPRLR